MSSKEPKVFTMATATDCMNADTNSYMNANTKDDRNDCANTKDRMNANIND